MQYQHAALINGGICEEINYNSSIIGDQCIKWNKLENISIIGSNAVGSIVDGNGHSGWYNSNLKTNNRPCLLNLMWINNLYISNITFTNSPFWTIHPLFSSNIIIEYIIINTDGPNTDGIDPDSSNNIIIKNNYITTGDDCIAIKSGKNKDGILIGISSNNITIINNIFGNGHGISIGSEMSGNITNILFKNLTLINTENGPRIKSCVGRGGMVSNITYEDIIFNNIGNGFSIDQFYSSNDCDSSNNNELVPIFENFTFNNIYGTVSDDAGEFECLKQKPCVNIIMNNVNITKYKNGFQCQYAYGIANNVSPSSCLDS